MTKVEKMPARKQIGRFAGPLALYESKFGCVRIKPVDQWSYDQMKDKNRDISVEFCIYPDNAGDTRKAIDPRLFERLRRTFPHISVLRQVPYILNSQNPDYNLEQTPHSIADIFPTWFYCPKCYKLKQINDWYDGALANNRPDLVDFVTPWHMCKKNADRKTFLTQVQFVAVSERGELTDVPWKKLISILRGNNVNIDEKPEATDLEYKDTQSALDLKDTVIKDNNNQRANLGGLLSTRYTTGGQTYSIVDRNTNQLYHPKTVTSLYIPSIGLSQNQIGLINYLAAAPNQNRENVENTVIAIYPAIDLFLLHIELNRLFPDAANGEAAANRDEVNYREQEYGALTQDYAEGDPPIKLKFNQIALGENEKSPALSQLVQIPRLQMTTVQTGYECAINNAVNDGDANQEDAGDNANANQREAQLRHITARGLNTTWLPATSATGEGILVVIDEDWLTDRVNAWMSDEGCKQKLTANLGVFKNSAPMREAVNKFGLTEPHNYAAFCIVHTICHAVMKELEFHCGFPISSLKERLYVSGRLNDDGKWTAGMRGFMIYGTGGGQATLGGLIAQATKERFVPIFESAIEKLHECHADPVCEEGVGNGPLKEDTASCYSCCQIPEISCESANAFLDRRMVNITP